VGRDAAGASLAGNWRGFAEDQRLEPGDAVTLKKEAGATLRVTIHRARVSGALSRDAPGSFYDASCVKTRGEKDKRTHGTKTNEAGGLNRAFRARAGWIAAFAEAAAATDALFAHHGAKPGAAVVDAGVDCVARPGYGTDPATHAHSRRTRGTSHRRGAVRDGARDANGDERKPERPFLPALSALPSSPNAPSKDPSTDREARPVDDDVTEPRVSSHAKRVGSHGASSPRERLPLDVQHVATCGRRGVRVAPAGGARGVRRRGRPSAREERNGGARLATRAFENPVSFVSPESHARASVHRRARLRRGARRARRRPSRAAARGRDAAARVFAPQPDGDAGDADVSEARVVDVLGARRLGGSRPRSRSRVRAAVRGRAAVSRRRRRGRRARGGGLQRRARGAARAARRRLAETKSPSPPTGNEKTARRADRRRGSSPPRRGAAPMEGWTTPAASSRGTRQDEKRANPESR
jgi:hypothetical protein